VSWRCVMSRGGAPSRRRSSHNFSRNSRIGFGFAIAVAAGAADVGNRRTNSPRFSSPGFSPKSALSR
jgi:hypothetical protein